MPLYTKQRISITDSTRPIYRHVSKHGRETYKFRSYVASILN
jgi:hypothetical protein